MKMAKKTGIEGHCQEVEACLRKNNGKYAYQLVKDIQKNLVNLHPYNTSQENALLGSLKYLSDEKSNAQTLTTDEADEDPTAHDSPRIPDEEYFTILQEDVKAAVKAPKTGSQLELTTYQHTLRKHLVQK